MVTHIFKILFFTHQFSRRKLFKLINVTCYSGLNFLDQSIWRRVKKDEKYVQGISSKIVEVEK